MGLYDDRLASLSESRSPRGGRSARTASPRRQATSVQSLLFSRDAGWTPSKARDWAKANGYSYGKVHVTDQYVRIRQFDAPGAKIHRTVPFGRGIRAVVTREGREGNTSMAKPRTVNASRRRKKSRRKSPSRRRRPVKAAVAPKRRRKRRKAVAEAPRKRRTARRKRSVKRRRRVTREAWRGDSAGHSKAAKKGHRRRKARKASAPKRRRRSRKAREVSTVQAPRKRRRSSRRRKSSMVMEAPRRRRSSKRRSRTMRASMGGGGGGIGMIILSGVSGGFGFVLADGIDRLLATYNPSATERPKDKFTSDGAGTLGNTLNVASRPGLARAGAAIGVVAVPALGAYYIKNRVVKTALAATAFGASINGFKLIWNNVVMPMLRPSDTSPAALQKSYIARLYPSEVSAAINAAKKNPDGSERTPQLGVPGALSGPDVGPFALAGDPAYPSAAQALTRGVAGPGQPEWPTAQQALGTGDQQYPSAAQALYKATGQVGWQPGEASTVGPGPQPADSASCGCAGPYDAFLGSPGEDDDRLQMR